MLISRPSLSQSTGKRDVRSHGLGRCCCYRNNQRCLRGARGRLDQGGVRGRGAGDSFLDRSLYVAGEVSEKSSAHFASYVRCDSQRGCLRHRDSLSCRWLNSQCLGDCRLGLRTCCQP